MSTYSRNRTATIVGLDGSGKSLTAQQAALRLSETYPTRRLSVADSTGLYTFIHGEVTQTHSFIEKLEPHISANKFMVGVKLGAFALARTLVGHQGARHSEVLISVRDPYRIDPAVYSAAYSATFRRLSPQARLGLFDRLTAAPYPNALIHLVATPEQAQAAMSDRLSTDQFESHEKLQMIAEELPLVLQAYTRLFKTPVQEFSALRPTTIDAVSAVIEPLLAA